MTKFLRLLDKNEKSDALFLIAKRYRSGLDNESLFEVNPKDFTSIPGAPFAYWATPSIRELFSKFPPFESEDRTARQGLSTADDFRFVRCWWEVDSTKIRTFSSGHENKAEVSGKWFPLLKGGGRSSFVNDLDLVINYHDDGRELKAWVSSLYGNTGWSKNVFNTEFYFREGFSWSLRSSRFSPSAVPGGCIFTASRYQAFASNEDLPWIIALFNASINSFILRMCSENFERPKYVVGIVSRLPLPVVSKKHREELGNLFHQACREKLKSLRYVENSHYFVSPNFIESSPEGNISTIIEDIDSICLTVYGLTDADRKCIQEMMPPVGVEQPDDDDDDISTEVDVASSEAALSWAVGVAFGRFDLRMASKEQKVPVEPDPFDPLPAKSPGMLPSGDTPFHRHNGVLVDDHGNSHSLPQLVEQVLDMIGAPVTEDSRRWLQKEFFTHHLQRYSKGRRKAPLYWPLTTASGGYTLWLYYPSLNDQTLFTAVNDFVDPKLEGVRKDLENLRGKGASRTKQEEGYLESLSSLEHELADLRDSLLEIAPNYRPNHDDGVQISAAPLWKLFRHKPWQKVLKETWAKLEKGDYDWAHLAMSYWPDRVREKCSTDKSLAIAHDLEHLYIEPEPKPAKARGRAKKQDA